MTVIDWLVAVDKSLLPLYAAIIITIGLYGYLKPEKVENQETSYTEQKKINSAYDCDISSIVEKQKEGALTADGICGPKTCSLLASGVVEEHGDISPSTWSLRETCFIPTINDCLRNLPPIEDCAVAGTYRGHRVFRVNNIFDADTVTRDGDYVIFRDSLYLCKNDKLILIKYEN